MSGESQRSPAEWVDFYRSLSWCVIPAAGKKPEGPWKEFQRRLPTEAEWERTKTHATEGGSLFLVCGTISQGVVVADADVGRDDVPAEWQQYLGSHWGNIPRASTPSGGVHLFFQAAEGVARTRSDRGRWDLRSDGAGVILPSGGADRRWGIEPSAKLPPFELIEPLLSGPGPDQPKADTSAKQPARESLYDLLANPAVEGGRNVWLTKVAGHYARHLPDKSDYERHVQAAAARLSPALPDREVARVIESVWKAEDGKFHRAVAERKFNLRVDQEARSELAGQTFSPPRIAMSLRDLLETQPEEPQWLVENLVELDHNVLLVAQYKAGKTTLLLNLARALVDGDPFLGTFNVDLERRVCYMNYELTEADVGLWASQMSFREPGRVDMLTLRGEANPLASAAGQDWLVEFLIEHDIEVLIVDTFRAAYSGESHNDNAEVARFTGMLDRVKSAAGVSVLILSHHFGRKSHSRGEEHGQGAVELDNWADVRWVLTKSGVERFLTVNGRIRGLDESQLAYTEDSRTLILPDAGLGRGRASARLMEVEQTVLDMVKGQPGLNSRELRAELKKRGGATSEEFARAQKALVEQGRIKTTKGPRGSVLHYLPDDSEGESEQ